MCVLCVCVCVCVCVCLCVCAGLACAYVQALVCAVHVLPLLVICEKNKQVVRVAELGQHSQLFYLTSQSRREPVVAEQGAREPLRDPLKKTMLVSRMTKFSCSVRQEVKLSKYM